MTQPRTIEVSQEEWDQLNELKKLVAARKAKGHARAEARKELIKRYKPEYDGLVRQFGGTPR